MWELSWYRFEVDLSDEAGGVRRDAQGDELSELIPEEQSRQRRGRRARRTPPRSQHMTEFFPPPEGSRIALVIYCVVPEPLADELYPKLADYYEDDPNVTVIVDRRKKERRLPGSTGGGQREVRDRRRMRITGDFPPFAVGASTAPPRHPTEASPASCGGSRAGSRRPTRPWS